MKESVRSNDNNAIYKELMPKADVEYVFKYIVTNMGYTESRASEALLASKGSSTIHAN